jgi:hypothetical protein
MAIPKVILVGTLSLFAVIGTVGTVKKIFFSPKKPSVVAAVAPAKEIKRVVTPVATSAAPVKKAEPPKAAPAAQPAPKEVKRVDRIGQLFTTGPTKLPIVETITYSSQVPWLKGRPAWVGDYAQPFLNLPPLYCSQPQWKS